MRKKLFGLLLPFLLFLLCACGGDMEGWPKLELNLDVANFNEVSLEYHHIAKPSPRRPLETEDINYLGTSSDIEIIKDLYERINGLPYSEETYTEIDTQDYRDKVIITFLRGGKAEYIFTFYGYAVTKGYFVLDNGAIHKYNGDFVSGTYENMKDKLEEVNWE